MSDLNEKVQASDKVKAKPPNEELVDLVTPLLVEGKLLLPEDAERLRSKIAAGTIKAEDWLLAVEKSMAKERAP